MGRYYNFSNGDSGKFWFGCQETMDITEFGGSEVEEAIINWQWFRDDLPEIRQKVLNDCKCMRVLGMSYPVFMRKRKDKDYQSSTADEETQGAPWAELSKFAARISLGIKIYRGVKKEGDLSCDAEY